MHEIIWSFTKLIGAVFILAFVIGAFFRLLDVAGSRLNRVAKRWEGE